MADKYNLMRAFYDLVDQSQGLPKGTTPIGSLPLEKLIEMGKELAEYIAIMQWGTIGICGIILHEYKESCNKRTLRYKMEPYSYPWATAFTQQEMVNEMLDCNWTPDPLSQPDVAHAIFHKPKGGTTSLSPEERLALYKAARARNWSTPIAKETIKALADARRVRPDDPEILRLCIEAMNRRQEIGIQLEKDRLQGVQGEGSEASE